MERVREGKTTAWKALMGDFFGIESKNDDDKYKKWESENFTEIKKSDNSIKGLEKMFEHVSKTSRKRRGKEPSNIDNIKSPKVQSQKAKAREEQQGEREI
jgi:hypothetical protein